MKCLSWAAATAPAFARPFKNLWLTTCFLLAAFTAQAVTKTWNGSVSTNWATPANWTPAGAPLAGDLVEIDQVPDNQPVIFSGTMAKALRVVLYYDASLTINAGGELELASPLTDAGLTNDGTVTNNGLLRVKSGFHGIALNGSFVNNGTIRLGEATSSPYAFTEEGIAMYTDGGSFVNNSTGIIIILRPGNNGILLFGPNTGFTNHGKITVRNAGLNPATAATADGIDARGGDFVNETTGEIVISTITANGLHCRSTGSFTNKGDIKIGNVGLTTALEFREGINNTAIFTNTSTGQITIDTCSNNGILNQGVIYNSGAISMGAAKVNSISNIGLGNLAGFYNYAGATLTIKNAKTGMLSGGLGGIFTNYSGATVTIGQMTEDGINQFGLGGTDNRGSINIGSTGSIGRYGIYNACQFLNQFGAALTISNSTNNAILNTAQTNIEGLFRNGGTISLNNALNVGGAAISNTVDCTFENLNCFALIQIASNNTISNTGTFTNDANIIENGSGNSSVSTNSGTIQNLNGGTFTVTGSNTGVNSTATGVIWTGCVNTDWENVFNWHDLEVPVASDNALIPNRSIDPTIFAPTAAVAKSVTVQADAVLTINASSSLSISGSTADGLSSEGTVTSAGLLSISNTGGIGFYNGGVFNNNGAGELSINGTVNEGLFQWEGDLNNAAKIRIGNTGNIGRFGINNRYSTLDNTAGGDITVDRTGASGIFVFTGSLNNVAKITIGGIATVGEEGILNGSTINNNVGGEILIDRTGKQGIYNSFGTFNNYASLKIGSKNSIGYQGISNQSATFNNYPTGEVTIDRTTYDGIYNYLSGSFRAVNNSGKIYIGKTAAIGTNGIRNEADFNNNADGEITMDRTAEDGIVNSATFKNAGLLTIGATAAPTGDGLENTATFNNQACGEIALHDNLNNSGTFTNTGLLRMNTALAHTNTSTFTNDGIIEYPQGSLIPSVTNNDLIVKAVTGECPVANALQVGGSNSFTVGTTWYKNANLTMPAGTYDAGTNAFTVNGLAEGSTATLYFTVSDGSNTCTRTVSIRLTYDDVTLPTIACPANITLNTSDDGGADCAVTLTYTTNFSDNCDGTGPATHVSGPLSGTSLNVNGSPYTVVHTYTDMGGNTVATNCTFTVAVVDNTAPTFTCPAPPLTLHTNGATNCSVTIPDLVNMVGNEADNCALRASDPVTQSVPAGAYTGAAHGQTIPITVTVWDNATPANSTACTLTFTVNDDDKPSITCPANIARNTDPGQCSAFVAYTTPSYSDNCTANIQRTGGLASGSVFPKGVNLVEWKVTDGAGLIATCQFTVTVSDAQAPAITCPASIVRNTDANLCSSVAIYTTPTATDNCDVPTLTLQSGLVSASAFPKGTTLVVWKASDTATPTANTSTCSFTVTINDAQLPSITCPSNQTIGTTPTLCTGIATFATPTGSDNCTLPANAVAQTSGPASGSAFPKGQTTVTFHVTDAVGLTKTCTFRVTVSDTEAPAISCPTVAPTTTAANSCNSAPITYATPTATDNCAPAPTVVRIAGPASGSSFPAGTTSVVWRAVDGAGRSSTCSFAVTVTDAAPPVISCPNSISVMGSGSPCTTTVGYATPTATDNCGVQSVFLLSGQPSGSSFPAGATVNVWRAIDNAGLSATCSFTITVSCGASPDPSSGAENVAAERDGATSNFKLPNFKLSLAPNPATTEVTIFSEKELEADGELTVLDAQGRLMWRQSVATGQQQWHLDLDSRWQSGVYFATLRSGGQKTTKRLVVQRL